MLDRRGLHPVIWETSGAPIVFGELLVPGAARTLLFYIHYDGQPVDASRWAQSDPFTPVLRDGPLESGGQIVDNFANLKTFSDDWRIYARAAADDKAPIEAFLAALDAIHGQCASNIKLILDGEEEGGGTGLDYVLKKHKEDMRADLMVLLDGPQHPSGKATLYYGARGGAGLDLTVYTAMSAMHSGNYGNWMPDANMRLAQLLSSMVDASGKVIVPGFYSDVPPFSAATEAMLYAVPDDSLAMQRRYGIGKPDVAASSLQDGLNLPSLSIHTMQGGEAGGVIAAHATAQIAMRLVAENSPDKMIARVVAHVRNQGYWIVDKDPDLATLNAHPMVAKITYRTRSEPGGGAWRTDPTLPQARFVKSALRSVWGNSVVEIRTLGGGVPAGPFIQAYQFPVIGVSLVNYDDNQHTDNENLRLGNLWDGILTLSAIMTQRHCGPK
jgi:acetylornithine deacetylase/succinyl-diaminopimelate desuccinylase-like protein